MKFSSVMLTLIFSLESLTDAAVTESLSSERMQADSPCVQVSLPPEDLEQIHEMSSKLSLFLQSSLTEGHDVLKAALKNLGIKENEELNGSIQVYLTKYQSLLEYDLKNMITDAEKLFLKFAQKLASKEKDIIKKISYEDCSCQDRSTQDSRSALIQLLMKPEFKYLSNSNLNITNVDDRNLSKRFQKEFPMTTIDHVRPSDCADLLIAGITESGVYTIYPFRCFCSPGIKVYCDMETKGGGWTVFLNRQVQLKHENFNRTWDDYKKGFGTPPQEYWLGNEALYWMTNSREYSVRVDANATNGWSVWGEWANFKVNSEENKYRLTVNGYDANSLTKDIIFSYHNGHPFSTPDQDNDGNKGKCSLDYGPFWHNNCCYLAPTRVHGSWHLHDWSKTDSTNRPASQLQIKIRPKMCNDSITTARLNTHNCYQPSI